MQSPFLSVRRRGSLCADTLKLTLLVNRGKLLESLPLAKEKETVIYAAAESCVDLSKIYSISVPVLWINESFSTRQQIAQISSMVSLSR